MDEQGIALLVFFAAFALLFLVLAWDADHRCPDPKCSHRKENK